MKKLFYVFLLVSLAACEGGMGTIDGKEYLSGLEGPNVPTMKETLLTNARSAEQQGEWAAAAQIYQQVMENDQDNTEIMVALAECYRRTGQFDRAISLYDVALKKDSSLLGAKEGKGLALLGKGDYETPVPLFEEVMKVDDQRWKTLNALGILFATRTMNDEALQYFKQALANSPGNTSVMNNTGLVQALSGQFDAAADTLLQAGALAAGNGMDRKRIDLNLALVYAVAGKLEDARLVASMYYDGAQLSNNMGLYAHLAKDDQMSKAYLNTALTQSKTFYEKAWDNLQNVTTADQGNVVPKTSDLKVAPAAGKSAEKPKTTPESTLIDVFQPVPKENQPPQH